MRIDAWHRPRRRPVSRRRWLDRLQACFFLSVRVLSRLFRRRFLEELDRLYRSGRLQFFGEHAALANSHTFAHWLAPLRQCEWVVYAKRPFAGPAAVLAYLSRYTHRVAISNSRLLTMDQHNVTFRWKDYRLKVRTRHKIMTLAPEEFMRRFLLHVLPPGFHRIRHYGQLANSARPANLALARALLKDTTAPMSYELAPPFTPRVPPRSPAAFRHGFDFAHQMHRPVLAHSSNSASP